MTTMDPDDRTREALRALHEGEEMARLRVWARVRTGIEARRRRDRLINAGLVAAFLLSLASGWQALQEVRSPSWAQQERVIMQTVWKQLAAQQSDGDQPAREFAQYLAVEAQHGE